MADIRSQFDVLVVGAGIVGLAVARSAAARGYRVGVFERTDPAVGASIRNFGLIWPVGQPSGARFERAMRSRAIWLEAAAGAGFWCAEAGSFHLAYHDDEMAVLEEYMETVPEALEFCELLTPDQVMGESPAVKPDGLKGGLWSETELNIDPRQAIRALPAWLTRAYGVEFHFGVTVRGVAAPLVETSAGLYRADWIVICSGTDFETLYPEVHAASGITRVKLQMMRTVPQPPGYALGPALCAGLTLLHYESFAHCQGLEPLRSRLNAQLPFHLEHGIHVLLSQTAKGELTIGDHHAYGLTHDPFSSAQIDRAILDYLFTFADAPTWEIAERWIGIYAKLPYGTELIVHPEPGVTVVNGLGGAGMTLSFGLAEELFDAV